MKKYIFTDVDGVLNNVHTKGIKKGFAWIDDENIRVFSMFVRWCYERYGRNNVVIVLISSWRNSNFRRNSPLQEILEERLAEKEKIYIDDQTERIDLWSRGLEIAVYLFAHKEEVSGYIVLDDILYEDYKPLKLSSHWIQTSDGPSNGIGGLREKHLKKMKKIIDMSVSNREFVVMEQAILRQGFSLDGLV